MFKKLLTIVISTILGLLVAETILRFVSPGPVVFNAGTANTPKAQVYGWAYPPNKTIAGFNPDTGKITSWFRVNSQGWKDIDHEFEKANDVFRILVIGDSHTFGVPDLKYLYTRQLEHQLHKKGYKNVEVITMGLTGGDLSHATVIYENEGFKYSPDIVIYQNAENDLFPLIHGMRYIAKSKKKDTIKGTFLWPFYFDFDQQGKLKKYDISKLLKNANYEKNRQSENQASFIKFFKKTALYFNLQKTINIFKYSDCKKVQKNPKILAHNTEFMHTDYFVKSFEMTIEARQEMENHVRCFKKDFDKNFLKLYEKRQQIFKLIESKKTDQRFGFINPIENPFIYRPGKLSSTDKYAWKLMEALLIRLNNAVNKNGGKLIIFSEDGVDKSKIKYYETVGNVKKIKGIYYAWMANQWLEIDWSRGIKELSKIGNKLDIPVVPRQRPYPRYVFDNHANVEGNFNMALDILDFLENFQPFKKNMSQKNSIN